MTEHAPQFHSHQQPESINSTRDLWFAIVAAMDVGDRLYEGWRNGLKISTKLDRTLVTDIEIETNTRFNNQVQTVYGNSVAVLGEEVPLDATEPTPTHLPKRVFTIDTGDGSGELVATHRDLLTGNPINPTRPVPADAQPIPILESERTTCTGIGMLKNNRLWSGVAYNPFQKRLIVADRDAGGSFLVDIEGITPQGEKIRGHRLATNTTPTEGAIAWDHATWDGGYIDPQPFEQSFGTAPRNHYSAIDQAVDVALGASDVALFAGDTAHDIVPALAIVHFAGGLALTANGEHLNANHELAAMPRGLIYASRVGAAAALQAIHADSLSKK